MNERTRDLANRILVLAPIGRDAELLAQIADRGALSTCICDDVEIMCREFAKGAGAVFLTEEALYLPNSERLTHCVKVQEPWSDMPFVVLTSRGDANERVAKTSGLLEPLGNVTVIERPVRPATILAALRAALRNRDKQYEVRKRLYELRSSYERLSLTLRAAHAGAWEWSAEGDLIYWSPEFYDLFGLDPTCPPINERMLETVHAEDVAKLRDKIATAVETKQDFQVEFRVLHPRRGLRWVASFGHAHLDEERKLLGMSGIAIDITDRRLAQEELEERVRQRTRELTSANEEMQGFTYSVSHDLRAPLRAIVSTSEILLEECGPHLEREHQEMLRRQAMNANKLGDLIDELLKMSRLSRQEMKVSELDISKIAAEVANDVLKAGEYQCDIRVQPGMKGQGDENLVKLLLQNLIENACKFSPGGQPICVGAETEKGKSVFYVKDNGIGFEMRYAPKLFMPFERLVHDSEYPGTGIGLANVQRIASRHGGRVWAESEGEGRGSTFYFTLGAYMA